MTTATLTPTSAPSIGACAVNIRGDVVRIALDASFTGLATAAEFTASVREELARTYHAAEAAYRTSSAHCDLHRLEAAHRELSSTLGKREEAAGDLEERIRRATVDGSDTLAALVRERDSLAADKVRLAEAGKLLGPARKAAEAEWARCLTEAAQQAAADAAAEHRRLRDEALAALGEWLAPMMLMERLRLTDPGQLRSQFGGKLPE